MNKKLIIAAVSAAVVAPVVAHAEMTAYGRVNNAYEVNGYAAKGGDTKNDVSDVSSRFGFKANTDVGNGLSVHGRLEFAVTTDFQEKNSKTRIGSVGLSGPFGRVDIGAQWSSYFNTFGSLISPANTVSGALYSGGSGGGGIYRTDNTIKYSNNFGPVGLQLDYRANENSDGSQPADGRGIGLTLAATDSLTIALAADTTEGAAKTDTNKAGPDTMLTGISAKYTLPGGLWASLGFQNKEVDADKNVANSKSSEIDTRFFYVGGSFNDNTSWLLGTSQLEDDSLAKDNEASNNVWGIYHDVGGGFALYYEASDRDDERVDSVHSATKVAKSGTRHVLGMRINF